jgi:uncharacterized protein YceK
MYDQSFLVVVLVVMMMMIGRVATVSQARSGEGAGSTRACRAQQQAHNTFCTRRRT